MPEPPGSVASPSSTPGGPGTARAWRPDPKTAASLIGALFLYLAVIWVRSIPSLLNDVTGSCGSAGFNGLSCRVPGWVFNVAVVGLITPFADLLVVVGSARCLPDGIAVGW